MSNKVAFITGASRGIGKAIALKLAALGYDIVIAAKTTEPHPKLEGTIYSAAKDIEQLGVKALPIKTDIRSEEAVQEAFKQVEKTFGKIDVLVNNASAINLQSVQHIEMKRYDLVHDINVRGTFMVSKYAIPLLKKTKYGHILNLSPPVNLNPKWFGIHLAYTLSKYNMSMMVLGLAEELKAHNIAVNALWPQTIIGTAAVQFAMGAMGEQLLKQSRKPEIMADAAAVILSKNDMKLTGQFLIDETVLRNEGLTDFSSYAADPDTELMTDLFLD